MAKKQEECPLGAPLWMVTFSDLVTLLLTFFVLLLSMASMDPVKFVQAKTSIKDTFGWRTTAAPKQYTIPVIQSPPKAEFTPIPRETKMTYFKRVKNDLEMTKLMDQVEAIEKDNDSIVLRIHDSILFDKGKTSLNPSSYPMLRKIADIVRPLPMTIRIEGHTDDTPIARPSMTNWDLSVDRAVSVMRFYNRGEIFSIDRMAAVGYGDTRPVSPNTSEENRQKNRRVDFILKSNRKVDQFNRPVSPIPF
ncbi:OmpA/MotB family protein [Desulfogranum mediterraneum]|uniref:OmpA/MotB family protein n=1 Tax=Desulfogranum mediterraneum TaxID=160661 RepID=UPI000421ABBC|nr:flagellar motor protein MotB [Desulfogranum mediterraneum]